MKKSLALFLILMSTGKCLATTYTLIASGNWGNSAIWSPSGVPGAGDDVVFADNGSALTLTLTGNVSIRSLTYEGDYRLNTLNGSGIITLSENSFWYGGVIGGSVEIVVPSGKSFDFIVDGDSSNRRVLQQTAKITNNGSIAWTGNAIYFENSALIDNNGTFTDNTSTNRLYRDDGADTLHFINDGTFIVNSQEITFNIYFINNGTFNLIDGYMLSNVKLTNNGTINLNQDAANNNQLYNYISPSGTLHFGVNTTVEIVSRNTIGSTIGNVTGSAGAIVFGVFSNDMTPTVINTAIPSGIALDFSATGSITLNANQTLSNSTSFAKSMDGTGSLTVASGNTLTWTKGYFAGSVNVIVASGATLSLQGEIGVNALELFSNALITNNGSLDFNTGSLVLNTAQQMIENNGTFNLNGDWTIFNNNAGTSIFLNNGTLRKASGVGTATLQCQLSNASSASVSVEAGTLQFLNAVVNSGTLKGTGTMSFPTGQSLGGTISPGLSIGTLTFSGSVTITGNISIEVNGASRDVLSLTNNLVLSNATLTVVEAGSALNTGTPFSIISITGTQSGTFTSTSFPSGSYSLNYGTNSITLLNGPLPVELISFSGEVQAQGNLISWSTAQEYNVDRFVVERSHDAVRWEDMATVKATGFSLEERNYEMADLAPLQLEYYRLRIEDLDGTFERSFVIALKRDQGLDMGIRTFPNPSDDALHVYFTASVEEPTVLRLLSPGGQLLLEERFVAREGINDFVVPVSTLPGGVYFISLETSLGQAVQRFIKR